MLKPRSMQKLLNPTALVAAGCVLAAPCLVLAQATVSGSLDLTSFSATAMTGSLTWSGTWSLHTLSVSEDSLGGYSFNQQLDEPLTASSSSATTLASGSASTFATPSAQSMGVV